MTDEEIAGALRSIEHAIEETVRAMIDADAETVAGLAERLAHLDWAESRVIDLRTPCLVL